MKRWFVLFSAMILTGGCATSPEPHRCPIFKEHTEAERMLLEEANRLRSERGLNPLEHDHRLCLAAYCYGELLNSRQQHEWEMGKNLRKSAEWLMLHKVEFDELFEGGGYLPTGLKPAEVILQTRLEQALSDDWRRIGFARHG